MNLAALQPYDAPMTTYAAYRSMPDDGNRYELIQGSLAVTPPPSLIHQSISAKLHRSLMENQSEAGHVFAAPIEVFFNEQIAVQPDLVYVSHERDHLLQPNRIAGAPDLVVEILSPRTRKRDQTEKFQIYQTFGVSAYWIVDPEPASLEAYRLEDQTYVCEGAFSSKDRLSISSPIAINFDLNRVFSGLQFGSNRI